MEATLSLEIRALNYLLLGNGVGFAGCATALKDYEVAPRLHGFGWVAAIFGLGLISATVAFVRFQIANFEIMKRVLIGDEEPARSISAMALVNMLILTSGGLFILGVIAIVFKLAFL